MFIYRITRKETGDHYIGITKDVEKRWFQHKKRSRQKPRTRFHRALAKYGPQAFQWEVVRSIETLAEAKIAEMCLIYFEEPVYNLTLGGDGLWGHKPSAETRQKLRNALLGRTCSDETKAKISSRLQGRKPSPETLKRMSEAGRRRKPPSETTRAKLRDANNRRYYDAEQLNQPEAVRKAQRKEKLRIKAKEAYWANRDKILAQKAAQRKTQKEGTAVC